MHCVADISNFVFDVSISLELRPVTLISIIEHVGVILQRAKECHKLVEKLLTFGLLQFGAVHHHTKIQSILF